MVVRLVSSVFEMLGNVNEMEGDENHPCPFNLTHTRW